MLVHRLRRWPNINPTLLQYLVFAKSVYTSKLDKLTQQLRRRPNIEPKLGVYVSCLLGH